jgi:two-component system, LytTR family, sensor histidine kinase AlgZ
MATRVRPLLAAYWVRCVLVSAGAAFLVAVVLSASGVGRFGAVLPRALFHAGIMGLLVGSLLPRVARPYLRAGDARGWMIVLLLLTGLTVIGTVAACAMIELHDSAERFWMCVASAFQINLILSLALGVGMSLYEAQRSRAAALTLALRTEELEHERARKNALEARLASLEARLHPHFLFNTLNAISELVHESPERAERTVERLASLLRASLDATEHRLVPLRQELELVRAFLEIEATRFGDRLAWHIDVPDSLLGCLVPPLALQTLVENSVKHAIAPRAAGGRVSVEGVAAGDRILLTVHDDGPGFAPGGPQPGHGLAMLEARLEARFSASATLTRANDGGSRVTIELPRQAEMS